MNRVGDKIKLLREQAKMTQKTLAKKLGVSESFINEIEIGRKVASESIILRASKIFGKSLDDITMYEDVKEENVYEPPKTKKVEKKETQAVWNEAFGSILKNVPIYKMDMKTVVAVKQMPIVSNKVEGFAQDKVFYLKIEDNDMIGFRIAKGDVVFAHTSKEVENNAFCLVKYKDSMVIRQIKVIDKSKLLLISNSGNIITETVNIRDISIIAKLTKVEIAL